MFDSTEIITQQEEILDAIRNDVFGLIEKTIPSTIGLSEAEIKEIVHSIVNDVFYDLNSMTTKDPSAKGSIEYVYKSYTSFRAVMYYRVANHIFYHELLPQKLRQEISRDISEKIWI